MKKLHTIAALALYTLCISSVLFAAAPAKENMAMKTGDCKKEVVAKDPLEIKKEIDQTDSLAIPLDSSEAEEELDRSRLKEIEAKKNAKKIETKAATSPKK